MKPRALISVSDKQGIVEFAKELLELGFEIISTGGTATLLRQNNLTVTNVEDVTNFPEALDGRIKTLHPNIFGGLLSIRSREQHMNTLEKLGISTIDIVVVNLYPFGTVIKDPLNKLAHAVENIDIGGPSMIRAAAKNYPFVTVVTDKSMYDTVIQKLKSDTLNEEFRYQLAVSAFAYTASYDALIAQYLRKQMKTDYFPDTLTMTFNNKQKLRYGENPHQSAAYYQMPISDSSGIEIATLLHGKELSYNNFNDAQGAIELVYEFSEPVCAAVKHAAPCAVATGKTVYETFIKAREADPVSIFGGVVCFNREVDLETAEKMSEIFLEVIIAPSYSLEAFACLSNKKNLRIMLLPELEETTQEDRSPVLQFKKVGGGILLQQNDFSNPAVEKLQFATEKVPTETEINDLAFAMKVAKHVKSNAIVIAKDGQTLGIGGGQTSRIWAAEAALNRAGEKAAGAVMASDAYFPFPDVVTACGESGISAIIQPGGSINDSLSIDQCNKLGIAMVFTGVRHFLH